jgi:hypothetical protein
MANDSGPQQRQSALAFWKSYFAKFRRRMEDHERSETTATPLPFPDRRRARLPRKSLVR